MGNRFAGGIMPGAMPSLHKLGNPFFFITREGFFQSQSRRFLLRITRFYEKSLGGMGFTDNRDGICDRDGFKSVTYEYEGQRSTDFLT
jgi:hypothetical protein